MSLCKLCKQENDLIKKSHIIPDFMYKDLYDEKHKIRMFSNKTIQEDPKNIKFPSSGEYESNILCEDCDGKLLGSNYEEYASRVMYGGKYKESEEIQLKNLKTNNGIEYTACSNVSYEKFKLFLLSILWRASISSRPFFDDIKLGPHEEIIREMIVSKNPGEVFDYPILFLTYLNDTDIPKDLIAQPSMKRDEDGHRIFTFIIAGMVYVFYTCSKYHKLPDHVLASTIKPSNEMNILHIPKGTAWQYILMYFGFDKKK